MCVCMYIHDYATRAGNIADTVCVHIYLHIYIYVELLVPKMTIKKKNTAATLGT